MAKTVKLEDWIAYLFSRVNIDLYVWGANGEKLVALLPKIYNMEKVKSDVDRVLTLLQKRLLDNIDIYEIRCEDCSGLSIRFLLDNNVIPCDMNCNGLWDYITEKGHGKEIKLSEVKAGDFLFEGTADDKWHVGYVVDDGKHAIECQNHDVGVVETKISERKWKYAARPNWYEGDQPEPEQLVLTRELKLTNPMMRGDDVEDVQKQLNDLHYSCGDADGIFGKKTDIAVRNFQSDKGLTVDGIVGKKTAEALGFKWEG